MSGYPRVMAQHDTLLYISVADTVAVYSIANPAAPVAVGGISWEEVWSPDLMTIQDQLLVTLNTSAGSDSTALSVVEVA